MHTRTSFWTARSVGRFLLMGVAVAGIAASTARADSTLFNYYVDNYPHTAATCAAAEADVGQRFTAATGIAVFSTACDDHQSDYSLTISYAAAAALPFESTYDPYDSLAQGGYLSLADCAGDLAAQQALYAQETGLTPVVAYCFTENFSASSDYGIKLRIDGFGAALNHYVDAETVLGTIEEDADTSGLPPQTVAATIASNLARTGVVMSRAMIRTDPFGIVTLSLQYYAPAQVKMDYWEAAAYETPADCSAAAGDATTALAALNDHPLAVFCAMDGGYTKLSIFRVSDQQVSMEAVTGTYATVAACLLDKDRVLANARSTLGWNAGGAVCAGLSSDVQVYIFRRISG